VHSVDGRADTDFPFLHTAFDSTFVDPLDKVVTVHSHNTVEVGTVVAGMVVAAVGPYTVAVDTATVELETGVESSVVAVAPFVTMGYTAVVELETAVVPTIAAVGPHTVVEYAVAVELEGVAEVGGPDAVWPRVVVGVVAVLELALVVADTAVVFAMPIVSVYSPAPDYLGVAAENLAEPVLLLFGPVPALAVCLTLDFLAGRLVDLVGCVRPPLARVHALAVPLHFVCE